MRLIILSTLLLSTAACTSVEALRPEMHARVPPSRNDEIALINGLRAGVTTSDGKPVECFHGENLKAFRPKFVQGYRDFQETEQIYAGCLSFASLEGITDSKRSYLVRSYLDSGFGLVDLYCNRFFMIAAETRQSRQIQRNTGSALDTLVTTVATALGAGAPGLAVLNGGFEAADATYKNIDSAFLVAPDRDDLLSLVTAAQDKIRTDSYAANYQTYQAARSAVERYASKCTFDGMRDLVGVAVRNAAKAAKSGEPEEPPKESGANINAEGVKPTNQTKKPATDADLLGTAVPG